MLTDLTGTLLAGLLPGGRTGTATRCSTFERLARGVGTCAVCCRWTQGQRISRGPGSASCRSVMRLVDRPPRLQLRPSLAVTPFHFKL